MFKKWGLEVNRRVDLFFGVEKSLGGLKRVIEIDGSEGGGLRLSLRRVVRG